MKVLMIGPSETKAPGGMAAVIRGIRESGLLGREFEIHSFPSYIDGSLPLRLFYSAWAYFRFQWCFGKYDLFHIHVAERGSTFRKSFYLRTVKRAGKKAVVHIHGAEYLDFYDSLEGRRKQIADDLFGQADLVLALSESWKRELESRFPIDTCRILCNGVDLVELEGAVTDNWQHRNSFLMLGRMGERKGTYDLIDAVELALRQNPRLKVCLAGDGEVEKVRTLVAGRGLEEHIIVTGWIGRKEKLALLQKAATVVLPSYHEGLPMSVLEGMAAGKAIISTTVGGIPEAVTGGDGILIKPGDVPALAESLLRCSSDRGLLLSMAQKNRERAEELFGIQRMHRNLAQYYRQLMQ